MLPGHFVKSVWTLVLTSFLTIFMWGTSAQAQSGPPGLNPYARQELRDAGADKYLGEFTSSESSHGEWTKHSFDPQYVPDASYPSGLRPDGPVCVAGTDF